MAQSEGAGLLYLIALVAARTAQHPRRPMERYALGATRANGIRGAGRSRYQSPAVGLGRYDLEIEVREDDGVVSHHDDRLFWTGAQDGIPRAPAEPASYIDDQARPPACWRPPRLRYAHRPPRPP